MLNNYINYSQVSRDATKSKDRYRIKKSNKEPKFKELMKVIKKANEMISKAISNLD